MKYINIYTHYTIHTLYVYLSILLIVVNVLEKHSGRPFVSPFPIFSSCLPSLGLLMLSAFAIWLHQATITKQRQQHKRRNKQHDNNNNNNNRQAKEKIQKQIKSTSYKNNNRKQKQDATFVFYQLQLQAARIRPQASFTHTHTHSLFLCACANCLYKIIYIYRFLVAARVSSLTQGCDWGWLCATALVFTTANCGLRIRRVG